MRATFGRWARDILAGGVVAAVALTLLAGGAMAEIGPGPIVEDRVTCATDSSTGGCTTGTAGGLCTKAAGGDGRCTSTVGGCSCQ